MSELGPIRIDHIGIAATSLDAGSAFWQLLGLDNSGPDLENFDQGVKIRFLDLTEDEPGRPAKLEILEPLGEHTPVGKFINKRGTGIQQLCLRVENLDAMLEHLLANGVRLIDEGPKMGAHGSRIAFVHPSSTGGVLVELTED